MDEHQEQSNDSFDQIDAELKPEKPEGFTVFRGVQSVLGVALIVATLLTLWNPRSIFRTPDIYDLFLSVSTTEETPASALEGTSGKKIGILAGHWENSPGEVCADGTIEADINYAIANRVKLNLEEKGFQTQVFPEFDLDLLNYKADAFVAIYSGSCFQDPLPASGFKIGTSLTSENNDNVNNLAICLAENYQSSTRLPFSYEIIHPDHPSYHIFRDIHASTPAVLIEIGAMSTDRSVIISQSNTVVEGIAAGIQCFINGNAGQSE